MINSNALCSVEDHQVTGIQRVEKVQVDKCGERGLSEVNVTSARCDGASGSDNHGIGVIVLRLG